MISSNDRSRNSSIESRGKLFQIDKQSIVDPVSQFILVQSTLNISANDGTELALGLLWHKFKPSRPRNLTASAS